MELKDADVRPQPFYKRDNQTQKIAVLSSAKTSSCTFHSGIDILFAAFGTIRLYYVKYFHRAQSAPCLSTILKDARKVRPESFLPSHRAVQFHFPFRRTNLRFSIPCFCTMGCAG